MGRAGEQVNNNTGGIFLLFFSFFLFSLSFSFFLFLPHRPLTVEIENDRFRRYRTIAGGPHTGQLADRYVLPGTRPYHSLSVWYIPSCTEHSDIWYTKMPSYTKHTSPLSDQYIPSASVAVPPRIEGPETRSDPIEPNRKKDLTRTALRSGRDHENGVLLDGIQRTVGFLRSRFKGRHEEKGEENTGKAGEAKATMWGRSGSFFIVI
ncbi:hypothetical protein B296_00041528 [Ensete ventricosum]|uniref:Uncharacterized protein n=1 Tax=Ensete ventricosum TaxID=4639 RepID=A0A426ZLG4_ENSVE|nr:hypothetical protein B296_00041528 [Ensete ventricosum]